VSDISIICPSEIQASRIAPPTDPIRRPESIQKGDPITIGSIVLAAAASGGVLAKAFSPGGFLTKLAGILSERIKNDVRISITQPDGTKIELSGTSKEIESLLKKHFQRDRRG